MLTMREYRNEERRARLRYVAALVAQAGSVRQAAKLAEMDRPHFIRMRQVCRKWLKLTPPASGPTG
jgi:hypothetical protein